jgi:hypothetical protein
MDHNAQGRRPHYHRGRRGSDRRGGDRRAPQQPPEHSGRSGAEQVDVEQIMRDIRARIAQRHGIELTTPQIQELAARRLEAILDPRTINPTLTEQLRKAASNPIDVPLPAIDPGYEFDESTLFDTHRGLLRLIRRLLNPILKLFFNPTPLIQTLHTQARMNKQAAAREAERERRQTEWNALHYEILSRLVTEVSRVSIEMQALSGRVESLAARVDFNDRRVRTIESAAVQARPAHPRASEAAQTAVSAPAGAPEPAGVSSVAPEAPAADGGMRRKRRRRRGRRSGGIPSGLAAAPGAAPPVESTMDVSEPFDAEEAYEDDGGEVTKEPEAAIDVLPPAVETSAPPAAEERAPAEPAPIQPAPPPDEPVPAAPVDQPDPGPPDR